METFRDITIISIITAISAAVFGLVGVSIYLSFQHKNKERLMKTFNVVSSIAMVVTITIAILSMIGIAITGLYPGVFVLSFMALIPIASKIYSKRTIINTIDFQRNYYITFTILNLLLILVALWMTFVIVHDRVLSDCC